MPFSGTSNLFDGSDSKMSNKDDDLPSSFVPYQNARESAQSICKDTKL